MTTSEANGSARTDWRAEGLEELRAAMPGVIPEGDIDMRDGLFAEELVELGLVSVWGLLWSRDGLSKRDRSLVTISLLIALGAETELKTHTRIGLTNGLTKEEIAEVVYHAAGYVGAPRSVGARTAIREALGEIGVRE
ncbi:carboxymuconolactone decarboxylase family protein [Nocardia sp. KC 131]|uniref:carboxymuconolactone decarboxylase family protein n=1 Tax=Nocardia arseniciresistens TaxID=3392119 RepID=UPI00398E9318